MYVNLMCRKVLYVFLSLAIIVAPTIQQANAASSWSVSSAVSAGSRSIITATKSGYKSAVNVAPTAGRLGLKLVKGANWAALLYAAVQLAPDLADIKSFQPDYANNRVKYSIKSYGYQFAGVTYPDANSGCNALWLGNAAYGEIRNKKVIMEGLNAKCSFEQLQKGTWQNLYSYLYPIPISDIQYISIPAAAAQMIKNADAGHADSRAAIRETATEMVIGGQFDQDLLNGAVPTNDTRPLVPSVPISGNGNVGGGIGVGTGDDGLMNGGDLGKAADDARVAADNARKAAQAAKDAATAAANDARVAADKANDLVNSAVDQAIKDAAKDAADAAAQAAKDAAAVSDAAVKAANDRASAAERAAEAAASAAKDAAAQAAKDLDAAKAAGDAAAIAAAQAAKDAADAALADAKAKQEAAEKAAEKAKAEAAKPFELPAFCTWASVVCNYFEWVKGEYASTKEWVKEEPVASPAELMPISDVPAGMDIFTDKAEAGYVSFESECPADVLIPVSLMGATQTLSLSYVPFCHFASMIRYAVILGAWISGLLIISGGRGRE